MYIIDIFAQYISTNVIKNEMTKRPGKKRKLLAKLLWKSKSEYRQVKNQKMYDSPHLRMTAVAVEIEQTLSVKKKSALIIVGKIVSRYKKSRQK